MLTILLAIYLTGFGCIFGIAFVLSSIFGPRGEAWIGALGLALFWPLVVLFVLGALVWEGIRRR